MIIKFPLCEYNGLTVRVPCWVNELYREPVEWFAVQKWSSEKFILSPYSPNKQASENKAIFFTEKDKYHMISLICGKKLDEHLQTTNRLTDIENKLMVTKGGRGRTWAEGINQEFGNNRYTLLYIK